RILTMHVALPDATYKTPQQRVAFFNQVLQKFAALPGVEDAAVASNVPFGIYETDSSISIQNRPPQLGEYRQADFESVNAGYFRAMNIPLREGRFLADSDGADQAPVAVVSQSFARRYFPAESPVGKMIKKGGANSTSPWMRIVGVVGDIRYNMLGSRETPPLYIPYQQAPEGFCFLAIRTAGDPSTYAAAVRGQIESVDPEEPVSEVKALQMVISNGLLGFSYVSVIMTVLGIIALVLASVGVYGVMAYSVTERTHEIGVRMALGAQRRQILRLVFARGVLITAVGLLIGLPVSLGLARVLSGIFFGVSATDFAIFTGMTFLLCFLTLMACYMPARHATQVDPIVALRQE
ncbi:MAG: ABC transporter permease, partial [Bryobacteraceae bacterium]